MYVTIDPDDNEFALAQFVTLTANASLDNERVLTVDTTKGLSLTDGGAGSTITVGLSQDLRSTASPIFSGLTVTTLTAIAGQMTNANVTTLTATGGVFTNASATTLTATTGDFTGATVTTLTATTGSFTNSTVSSLTATALTAPSFTSTTAAVNNQLTVGSLTGILKGTTGVVSAATAGTDYCAATTGSSILKASSGNTMSANLADTAHNCTFSTAGVTTLTLPTTGSVLVDAASDGSYYSRKDGVWAAILPGVAAHNDLGTIQGGGATERYHLTAAQQTIATQAASGSQAGYLSSADWTTFNNKYDSGDSPAFADITATSLSCSTGTFTGTTVGTLTATAANISSISGFSGLTLTNLTVTTLSVATVSAGATITTPTITKPTLNATNPTAQTYTPGSGETATLDCSLGNLHFITMPAGNITVALSNITNNQCILVAITQDGTGSRTVTWFTTIRWAGGSAPTLTTTGSKRDILGFIRTGANTYDGFVIGQNL
jgi:hypothetical protein